MSDITFLGTGGGRYATIYQMRATGGIYIKDLGRLHLDPGPSALYGMKALSIDPALTDCILVSHCHPDHYADAEMLVEGMTRGGYRRNGKLISTCSVLRGNDKFSQAISNYHQSLPEEVISVIPGDKLNASGMTIKVTPTIHSDPDGVGFRFETRSGSISYVSDSEFDESLVHSHRDARVLIINLTCSTQTKIPRHMHTEDAARLIADIDPEVAVLTHFGVGVLEEGVEKQVRIIENESKVHTIAANDFMTISVDEDITLQRAE
ncbi:MAG: MBL fold metallo-hydrolase [Euryarchaeota archaeon]|nr:MBL fold metallo-hydrolase [Euryarchaeota archaeon]